MSINTPGPELEIVNPTGLYDPTANGYSHVVIVRNASAMAHIAGQGGEDATGTLPPLFADQVEQAYANLRIALSTAEATPSDVAKVTTYVVDYDPSMLAVMTQHARNLFGAALPAQTLVPVSRLALDGMLFEIDAVAALTS